MSKRTISYDPNTRVLTIDDPDETIYHFKVNSYHVDSTGGVCTEQSASAPPSQFVRKTRPVPVATPVRTVVFSAPPQTVSFSSAPQVAVFVSSVNDLSKAMTRLSFVSRFPACFNSQEGCYVLANHTDLKNQVAHSKKTCHPGAYWISKDDWEKRVRKNKGRDLNAADFCGHCCK